MKWLLLPNEGVCVCVYMFLLLFKILEIVAFVVLSL